MPVSITEILSDRTACIGSDILHRRWIARGCRNDDGVIHRPVFFESLDDLRNGRTFLSDGNVYANDLLPLLIDDSVDRDSRLSGLSIADN